MYSDKLERIRELDSIWLISLPFQVVFSWKKHATSCIFLKVVIYHTQSWTIVVSKKTYLLFQDTYCVEYLYNNMCQKNAELLIK